MKSHKDSIEFLFKVADRIKRESSIAIEKELLEIRKKAKQQATDEILKIIDKLKHTNCKIVFGSGKKSWHKYDIIVVNDLKIELKQKIRSKK